MNIDTATSLIEALHGLRELVSLELQLDAVVPLVGIVLAVAGTLAWTRFLHPKR
jgi:hypothetical protein